MKKFVCICLVLILCFGICGCQKTPGQPEALPQLYSWEVEVVELGESNSVSVSGNIIGVLEPDVLEVRLSTQTGIDQWGETVYVVTEQISEWCVGDEILAVFTKVYRPKDAKQHVRIIADRVIASGEYLKPIIYFYPETAMECSAKITLKGKLTCTYPEHGENGWENFVARPDGTLVFPDGKEYYALYWEGEQRADWDFSTGYCVRGEDTAAFLEWALAAQGLTAREANEFIVYWLPLMQENPYNVISFQTTTYTDGAKLDITPAPDSLLRIFMAYYATDTEVEIEPQTFDGFIREGFTVVEWGGGPA